MTTFRITSAVSERFPELFARVTIIEDFSNSADGGVAADVAQTLRQAHADLRRRYADKAELAASPLVSAYFDLFRAFGVNPKRVRPSHYALAERVVRGGELPSINLGVDLYNAYSLSRLVPFGGEDLDTVDEYFELGFAEGDESWHGIGESSPISPAAGDLIWRDAREVSTISLNHRQCEKTKLTQTTRRAYFISEGLSGTNDEHIAATHTDFAEHFVRLLGGVHRQFVIDGTTPDHTVE